MLLNETLPLDLAARVRALENIADLVPTQLTSPLGVAVSVQGNAGSTTYAYLVAAISVLGVAPSAAVQVTTGNATLGPVNLNQITWSPVAGAMGYAIYRSSGGTAQGLIATVLPGSPLVVNDTGLTATGNVPTANTTGCIVMTAPLFSNGPVFDGPLPITLTNNAGQTLTVAHMLTPLLVRAGTPGGAFSDTTPTAAAMVAALAGVQVGCGFNWVYRNTANGTNTLLAGSGVTLAAGNTNTTATNQTHTWFVVFTNVTPGSEAVTIYSLGSALAH